MSGKYTGVTFANQKVSPSDDAIIRRAILPDGKLTGCEITYSGSTLTMAAGQLMVCGRQIRNPAAQNWAVVDATSGFARLVMTIDLTRTATNETFDQVTDSIEYATAENGFVSLDQSDINGSGTRYQVAVCTVSLGAGGITGIVSQLEKCEVGAGLNFKVVGGVTQPTGPKENTIWVNTDQKITGWYFHPTQPENMAEGEVWFSVDTYSPVAFNALKKNSIQICPISAKQYVSGMLVNKTAKIYQGGKWVELVADGLIYENGTQYKSLVSIAGTVNFDIGYITLSVNDSASRVGTADKINLTKFKTVTVDYSDKTSAAEIAIKIMSDRNNVITRQNHINTTSGTISCDISSVTGDCYVEVQLYSERSASARINKIQVLN